MITQEKMPQVIFYQILSTNLLKKCMEISLENLYVDTGAWRVNGVWLCSLINLLAASATGNFYKIILL